MSIVSVNPKPKNSFTCLALVKKHSPIHSEWKLEKPSYCIYEYDKGCDSHEIRWADGSWQKLDEIHFSSLALLPELGEKEFDEILSAFE